MLFVNWWAPVSMVGFYLKAFSGKWTCFGFVGFQFS